MKVIGLSGKKGAGKDTAANFLMFNRHALFGHKNSCGRYVEPNVRLYAFGNYVKEYCERYLGIPHESLWGTMAQKDAPVSHFTWQKLLKFEEYVERNIVSEEKRHIPMTGREVMQYVGEFEFEDVNPDQWVDQLLTDLLDDNPDVAIVTDMRRPNEFNMVKALQGYVLRLSRAPHKSEDLFRSETMLDAENFDGSKFDMVIPDVSDYDYAHPAIRDSLQIADTHRFIHSALNELGLLSDDGRHLYDTNEVSSWMWVPPMIAWN